MSTTLINHLLQSYGYIAVFLFVGLESMGVPLPGETMLIAAAVYAGSTHHLNIAVVGLVAAAAAVAGDNAGFWLGKHGGARLVRRYGRWVRLDARKLKVGRYLFDRHGGKIVFFGRFTVVLRTYAAFLAGLNGMRRSRFFAANAAAAVLWSAGWASGAYALGSAATRVGSTLTAAGLGAVAVLAVALTVAMKRSMRRLEQRADALSPADELATAGPGIRLGRAGEAGRCHGPRRRERRACAAGPRLPDRRPGRRRGRGDRAGAGRGRSRPRPR